VVAETAVTGQLVAAIVVTACVIGFFVTAAIWTSLRSSSSLPRVRSRALPSIVMPSTETGPVRLVVAGRTYEVADETERPPETCPWCLGSLDGVPASEISRCDKPYCGRAAHRRHNEEHGGCGGICSIVRA
jgi:hypothetical protein